MVKNKYGIVHKNHRLLEIKAIILELDTKN